MAKITSKNQKERIEEKVWDNDDTFGYDAELAYKESQRRDFKNFLESTKAKEKKEKIDEHLAELYQTTKEAFEKNAKTFFKYEYQLRSELEGEEINEIMAEVTKEAKSHWDFIITSLYRSQNRKHVEQKSEDFVNNWITMAFEDSLWKNNTTANNLEQTANLITLEQTVALITDWPKVVREEVKASIRALIEYFNSVPFDTILTILSKHTSLLEEKQNPTQTTKPTKTIKR